MFQHKERTKKEKRWKNCLDFINPQLHSWKTPFFFFLFWMKMMWEEIYLDNGKRKIEHSIQQGRIGDFDQQLMVAILPFCKQFTYGSLHDVCCFGYWGMLDRSSVFWLLLVNLIWQIVEDDFIMKHSTLDYIVFCSRITYCLQYSRLGSWLVRIMVDHLQGFGWGGEEKIVMMDVIFARLL